MNRACIFSSSRGLHSEDISPIGDASRFNVDLCLPPDGFMWPTGRHCICGFNSSSGP